MRLPQSRNSGGIQARHSIVPLPFVVECSSNTCSLYFRHGVSDDISSTQPRRMLTSDRVFASVLFVSTPEALVVIVRLLASAICCRLIVTYELYGMRYVSQTAKQ
jgi:hypothetical protein